MRITRFEDIEAWKAARNLANDVYDMTGKGLFNPDLSLQRQMRSCATSVMANIAEGFDSASHVEFSRFLKIARRSATELQSHLYVAVDRHYVARRQFETLYAAADSVKKQIGGFIRYLKNPKPRT
jgi:four helix bundle protein